MSSRLIDGIELISLAAKGKPRPKRPPLLFVHGAFSGAWVWAERFMPVFAARGYPCHALSLRGHGASAGRDALASHGIRDYVDDVRQIIGTFPQTPVLIGHSMGGFVVQKTLEHLPAPAAVLMSSVPPQGLMASSFHLVMQHPGLFVDINRLMGGAHISDEAVRSALFAEDIPDEVLHRYLAHMEQESPRAIWDMTMFNLVNLSAVHRTPLMVLGTEEDRLIPPFLVQSTARAYDVPDHLYRHLGHAFMLEQGGDRIATAVADWLDETL
jgi:non-heme chloroperoxidase